MFRYRTCDPQAMQLSQAVFFLFLAFSSAMARATVADGTHWPKIIQALHEQGIDRVGDFDLLSLAQRGHDVHFYPYNGPLPSVLTGSRESAFFLRSKNKVFIHPRAPHEDFGALPQLELHEVLGTLGYDDSSTALSSALVILSHTSNASDRAKLLKIYGDALFSHPTQVARLEGGSSVGGGGDLPTIDVKAQVLEVVREMQADNPDLAASDFFRNFPNIDFEPMRDPLATQVSLRYRFVPNGRHYSESFTVLVPMSRWERKDANKATLLKEIADKLLALFAVSPHQAARSFRPSGCGPSVRASFLATNDAAVSSLQDFRAGLIQGCQDVSDLQAAETTVPPPPEGAEPAIPGFYHFSCVFSYPGFADDRQTLNVPEGRAQSTSLAFSPRQNEFVFGRVEVNAEGQLRSLQLFFHTKGKFHVSNPKAVSATHGSATLDVEGAPLRFRCEKH